MSVVSVAAESYTTTGSDTVTPHYQPSKLPTNPPRDPSTGSTTGRSWSTVVTTSPTSPPTLGRTFACGSGALLPISGRECQFVILFHADCTIFVSSSGIRYKEQRYVEEFIIKYIIFC